jgi:hypothetical protein
MIEGPMQAAEVGDGGAREGNNGPHDNVASPTRDIPKIIATITGVLGVCTAIYVAWLNGTAIISANRAWVGIDAADVQFAAGPTGLKGDQSANAYRTIITIANDGRSPALNVALLVETFAPAVRRIAVPYSAGANEMCARIHPSDGGPVIRTGKAEKMPGGFVRLDPNHGARGSWLVVVRGCVAYRTFSQTHHTWFCRYLDPEPENVPIEKRTVEECADGNGAD